MKFEEVCIKVILTLFILAVLSALAMRVFAVLWLMSFGIFFLTLAVLTMLFLIWGVEL